MKRYLCILLFAFLSIVGLHAQSNYNFDSLFTVWRDTTQTDSVRIFALNRYTFYGLVFTQPDTAYKYIQIQLDFCEKREFKHGEALAYNSLGGYYWVKGLHANALLYFKKSLDLFIELKNNENAAVCQNNIGIIYRNQGNNVKALAYLTESYRLRLQNGDSSSLPNVLNNIGNIYQDQNDYVQARVYYEKSLRIRQRLGDTVSTANELANIGLLLHNEKKYDEALNYFERALAIYQKYGENKSQVTLLNNMGLLYKDKGDDQNALLYLRKSSLLSQKIGDNSGIASALSSLGRIEIDQKKYTSAIAKCDEAFEIAERIGSMLLQKESCNCLFSAYKALGNADKALLYHQELARINDSIQRIEVTKNLQRLEFERQVAKDSLVRAEEKRIVREQHEQELRKEETTRNAVAAAGFLFFILAGSFYSRWRFVKRSNALINREKERSESLLLNILPAEVAQELKEKGRAEARAFERITILFTDFENFTKKAEKLSPAALVEEINTCFERFDLILEQYNIEKIKTIGDAYMAVGGLSQSDKNAAKNSILAALAMQAFIKERKAQKALHGELAFDMRIGIHTGPVVAGIVGLKKFQYDIWGDTVNTASRVEGCGQIEKVNISEATYALVKDDPDLQFTYRGKIAVKDKGEMDMWFVESALAA